MLGISKVFYFSLHIRKTEIQSLVMLWLKSVELSLFNYTLNLQRGLLMHKKSKPIQLICKGFLWYMVNNEHFPFFFFLEGPISESDEYSVPNTYLKRGNSAVLKLNIQNPFHTRFCGIRWYLKCMKIAASGLIWVKANDDRGKQIRAIQKKWLQKILPSLFFCS